MEKDTDIIEFDFPDYEEPYPTFPDVKAADFNKEESYSRNRDIADRLYTVGLERKKRRDKKTKKRKRFSRAKRSPLGRILSIIMLFLLVEASALFVFNGGKEKIVGFIFDDSQTHNAAQKKIMEKEANEFLGSAKVTAQLESVGKSYSYGKDTAVTVKFTVENTGDREISFQPCRFYAVWNNGFTSPMIADVKRFLYDHEDGFWVNAYVPVGERVSFTVKYYISEKTEIDCFAYNVHSGLFETLCEY